MKPLVRLLLLSALALIPAGAFAAAASKQVWVTNCRHEHYKPKKIVVRCGDGSEYLTKLKWSHWSMSKAKGKGTFHRNSCTPSCVMGHFKTFPVKIKLYKPISCPGQKQMVFDRITITFGKKHPPNEIAEDAELGCPI